MKTKRSKNNLLISFSKQTIANLNHREISNVKGKENFLNVDDDNQLSDANAVLENARGCTPAPLFPDWFPSRFVDCP